MSTSSHELSELKKAVEASAARKMHTTADFNYLSGVIAERCKEMISESTLKRIWGYVEGYDSSRYNTLSILSRFIGFMDWDDFCNSLQHKTSDTNDEHQTFCIHPENLKEGEKINITWLPDSSCQLKYLGNNSFVVLESKNTKLQVDDTFSCPFFIIGEPIYITNLVRNGASPSMFVTGKNGGLKTVDIVQK